MDIMNHVDILDLVNVIVFQPEPGKIEVQFQATDKTKCVFIDPQEMRSFGNILTQKMHGMQAADPKNIEYIKEFSARMLSEWARSGLAEIGDAPENQGDPYREIREIHGRR